MQKTKPAALKRNYKPPSRLFSRWNFLAISLLLPTLASAQLGPAGVPGAPALVHEITEAQDPPSTTPETVAQPAASLRLDDSSIHLSALEQEAINACKLRNNIERCKKHYVARKACDQKTGKEHFDCLYRFLKP